MRCSRHFERFTFTGCWEVVIGMRSSAAVILAFFVVSCAAYTSDDKRPMVDDPYEETGDEFDLVESLRENPIDPCRAELEDLLSIPGFPRRLAMRVIEVTGDRSGRRGWIKRLTPPERHAVYSHREFLVLPDRPSTRFSSWLLGERLESHDPERKDGFFSCLGDGWRAFGRGKISPQGRAVSFNVSGSVFSGALSLCGGDFLPDFAMGLLFSGCSGLYPFSNGYPFRSRRWIVQKTSFYGNSLRGFAGEFWRGPLRAALFAGRPWVYDSGCISADDRRVCGGRIGFNVHGSVIGATFSRDPSYRNGYFFAADGKWRMEKLLIGGELACQGWDRFAGVWGMSFKGRVYEAGILSYSMPFGFGTGFSGLADGAVGDCLFRRGFSIVLRRRIRRRAEVRSAFERAVSQDDFKAKCRDITRVEVVNRWKGVSLKLAWQLKRYDHFDAIPYPGGDPPSYSNAHNFNVLLTWKFLNSYRLRASIRCPLGEETSGCLLAPSFSFPFFSDSIRATAAVYRYHPIKGMPVFYFYEPSFKGRYPWRSVRGGGLRGILLVETSARWFRFLWKVSAESGKGLETGLQVSVDL